MAETGREHGLQQALEENERLRRELRACQEENAGLLAELGHRMRTPLNGIQGLAELLALTALDSQQATYLEGIRTSATALKVALDGVVACPRGEARGELDEVRYGTAELLAEVSDVMGLRAEDKGLFLEIDARPEMPAALWGDVVRLKQVMLGLLTGAIDRTAAGVVRLWLDAEPADDGCATLVCRVTDEGAGEGPEPGQVGARALAARCGGSPGFEAAAQVLAMMGGAAEGEVLPGGGLALTFRVGQRVVDRRPLARVENPGRLKVLVAVAPERADDVMDKLAALGVTGEVLPAGGQPGQGGFTHCVYDGALPPAALGGLRAAMPDCVFVILRSIRDTAAPAELRDAMLHTPLLVTGLAQLLNRHSGGEAVSKAAVVARTEALAVRNTRLLVVDDNAVNLMVSEEMLRALGAEVDSADGGRNALDMCAETRYDVIFMDHIMPGVDGVEVTRRLRGRPGPNRQTPIVALTANVMDDMRSYYVRQGMDDYLGKPVEFDGLRRVLCHWLPREKLVDAPAEENGA